MSHSGSVLGSYLRRALLALGALLCAFAIVAALWTRHTTRAYRFVYRLAPSGHPLPTDALKQTVRVLRARMDALRKEMHLSRYSAVPLGDDRVDLRFCTNLDPIRPLAWLTMKGEAQFRLLHPDPDAIEILGEDGLPPDYEVKVYRERRYDLTRLDELKVERQPFAVQRTPVMKVDSFRGVKLETVGARKLVVLTFAFKPEDAATLARMTALHAGRKMAMLIDGEMFFPPAQIDSAVTAGSIQVAGYFHIRPLRLLVKVLNCGGLPCALSRVGDRGETGARDRPAREDN